MIRCHHCEALKCPQEEYPTRLLPTPPPSYIDNLQSRLIKVQKEIFPASLKMILKTNYQLLVRRPAPETLVHPNDVIGEHRAVENSAHRHSAIHRRDAPRSIRGQRNPESRDGRSRSVRGQDPEYRNLKHQRRRKYLSLLKPAWMVFCTPTPQARSRSLFCSNQTSEWTTTTSQQLLKYRLALARSLRDCQMVSSKG